MTLLGKIDQLLAFLESNQSEAVYAWWDCNGGWKFILNGADVVEYHNINSNANAVAGKTQYETYMFGTKWLFKNQTNKDLFDANPTFYIPEYGAHCAYAMAKNEIAKGDPDAWTLFNGRLFINYDKNLRGTWSEDIGGYVKKSDANWKVKRQEMGWSNP